MYSIAELTEIIREIVSGQPITKVVLVGSYARNEATETSDIDIVLDGEDIAEAYWDILFSLEDRLSVPVELMTMRGLKSSLLRESILDSGVTLYEA
jgi:predicted nucleotidyltransferase